MNLRSSVLGIIKWLVLSTALLTGAANAQVPCLSGFVYDPDGNAVVDADLDFDDAVTGERMYTPSDNTDDYGFYRVCILPGLYNVTFSPPLGTHLMSKRLINFSLEQSQVVNITLDRGVVISGIARDSAGAPVADVDLDVDSLGGGRVFTSDDNSDSTGAYWVVIPPGSYRIRYTPPPGSRFQGFAIDSIVVTADTVVDIPLANGVSFSGSVTDGQGQGLRAIDVDLRTIPSGAKVFVPYNTTDSLGRYSIMVPTGLFNVRFSPPLGSRYVGAEIDSVSITGDLVWDQSLQSGALISCFVRDSTGAPLSNADLDFTETATGRRVFTPYDKTDINGLCVSALFPGSYTIRVDPPPGTILDHLTLDSVLVAGDTTFDFVLPELDRVSFSGRITNASGIGLPNVEIGLTIPVTETDVSIHNNETDSAGFFNVNVPLGNFNLLFSPESGSRYVGRRLEGVAFLSDTTWNSVVLDSGLLFTGQVFDEKGLPVSSVNFDFVLESNGETVFSPHDVTGPNGTIQTAVLPGIYNIQLTPPQGSGLHGKLFSGYDIQTDTAEVFFLSSGDSEIPVSFLLRQNYPNPFNENTLISYTLLKGSDVSIIFYNTLGQRVMTRVIGHQRPGYYITHWDGRGSDGQEVASGLYLYQLVTSYGSQTKSMLRVK